MRALPEGFVYHRSLPSFVRDVPNVAKNRFDMVKSRFYFGLVNGTSAYSFADVAADLVRFLTIQKIDVDDLVDRGLLTDADRVRFHEDVGRASDEAFARFASGRRRTRDPAWFGEGRRAIRPYPVLRPVPKRHVCLVAADLVDADLVDAELVDADLVWPAVARATDGPPVALPSEASAGELWSSATDLAAEGHVVRVLLAGEAHQVELRHGIWRHELVVDPSGNDGSKLGDRLEVVERELGRIGAMRPIDAVRVHRRSVTGGQPAADD